MPKSPDNLFTPKTIDGTSHIDFHASREPDPGTIGARQYSSGPLRREKFNAILDAAVRGKRVEA